MTASEKTAKAGSTARTTKAQAARKAQPARGARQAAKETKDTKAVKDAKDATGTTEAAVAADTKETADAKPSRLSVFKTYKLYVGGKFPRSESGRVYEVTDSTSGAWLANAPLSSRKDARDAVVAARKAVGGWSGATAYNRGQVLYRVAEMLEGRADQFAREVAEAEGLSRSEAAAVVEAA
ncbi:aldehyde dehydrogenase family protein, partial [Actinacidiphila rubida]